VKCQITLLFCVSSKCVYCVLTSTRHITTLLEDVVFFVILKENIGWQRGDALTEKGTPDRDRQKLLQDQNVLKEVSTAGWG